MKKLKLFSILIILSLFLINCSSDDDNYTPEQPTNSITRQNLIGTWHSNEAGTDEMTAILSSDGKITTIYHEVPPYKDDYYYGTWTLSKNILTVTENDPVEGVIKTDVEILELTNTTAKIKDSSYPNEIIIKTFYKQ